MSFPQAPSESAARTRWLKIAATVWLLLTSTLAAVNSVGLSRLSEQAEASAQDAQVQALGLRLAELEQQAKVDRRRPAPLGQVEFATAQRALDERIARVEAAQSADSPSTCRPCRLVCTGSKPVWKKPAKLPPSPPVEHPR